VNYRHPIHAGNFADVFKHIFRSRVLLRLGAKLTAIRYIETHAGSGIQELFGREAGKTSEWRGGRLPKLAAAPLLGIGFASPRIRTGKARGEHRGGPTG
jgi:23S rRNA (adenine2030-N6)-methyltransferase